MEQLWNIDSKKTNTKFVRRNFDWMKRDIFTISSLRYFLEKQKIIPKKNRIRKLIKIYVLIFRETTLEHRFYKNKYEIWCTEI